jgi:hypothetical protein
MRRTHLLLPAGMALLLAVCAGTHQAPPPCTHDEAIRMGAILHEKLDIASGKLASYDNIEAADEDGYLDAFDKLLAASDAALRGDDETACRLYRALAAEEGISLAGDQP